MYEKGTQYSLGNLVDAHCFNEPLELGDIKPNDLLNMLKIMLTIRVVEEKIAEAIEQGLIKTPCHLGVGQEGVAVGISSHLNHKDRVFSTHRSHSHYLAMGGGVYELIAEVFGKADGASNGMGGSMHLYGEDIGFMGSVPIVGATIPLAVGAAMAAKMDNSQAIGVCYFGDGAAEEGVLHESLNLASIYELPVLFVCENNLYSSHLDINLRQPSDRVARFAEAHCMDAITIDGNDVVEVANISGQAIQKMRNDRRPCFIEAVTYRWRGHVGPDENVDVGVRRSQEELVAWKKRDPIKRLVEAMFNQKTLTQTAYIKLTEEVNERVTAAVEKANAATYPSHEMLYDLVYKD